MNKMEIAEQAFVDQVPFPRNYASRMLVLVKGEGSRVEDRSGNRYLDFGTGIAVNALGHGREDLARIAYEQMSRLAHVSNLYTTEPALELGEKLVSSGPFAAVHFGNSGTEANEAAIKYARLYALRTRGEGHHNILSFTNAFHGRTLGALACTPTAKYQDPFKPLMSGCQVAPYNDVAKLEAVLDGSFAAVLVEVVQGEGGLDAMTPEFAKALNRLCRKHDVALIADEVQTGLGRTGTLFASSAAGLEPDIITLAKPLAGGLPLSATLIPARINDQVHAGEHGTTFGGGPVTTAVALKVWEIVSAEAFLAAVRRKGDHLAKRLQEVIARRPAKAVRVKGRGLLLGLELRDVDPAAFIERAQLAGLLVLRSGTNIIRIAPPLVIEEADIDAGVAIIDKVLAAL
jgi:acetylornithine/N-succinyldiaminopimelate aminotransferase